MSRLHLDYTAPRAPVAGQGFNPDVPVAGFYRTRLRRGAVQVGVRIWCGAPLDPVTGEEMDRSHRWQAQVNGQPVDLERVWPRCADDPVDEGEYRHLCGVQAWGEKNAPDSPQADPTRAVDLLTAPIPLI